MVAALFVGALLGGLFLRDRSFADAAVSAIPAAVGGAFAAVVMVVVRKRKGRW